MKRLVVLLLFCTSCKHVEQGTSLKEIDYMSIERAVQRFSKEFNIHVDSTLSFSEAPFKGYPGKCFVEGNHITVNKEWWLDVAPKTREALIFHELGHCMLGLGHDPLPGIMNGFIGHTANHYLYFYEESVEWMNNNRD